MTTPSYANPVNPYSGNYYTVEPPPFERGRVESTGASYSPRQSYESSYYPVQSSPQEMFSSNDYSYPHNAYVAHGTQHVYYDGPIQGTNVVPLLNLPPVSSPPVSSYTNTPQQNFHFRPAVKKELGASLEAYIQSQFSS
jgi:hypothetical protein